jgi:hypothetical protein
LVWTYALINLQLQPPRKSLLGKLSKSVFVPKDTIYKFMTMTIKSYTKLDQPSCKHFYHIVVGSLDAVTTWSTKLLTTKIKLLEGYKHTPVAVVVVHQPLKFISLKKLIQKVKFSSLTLLSFSADITAFYIFSLHYTHNHYFLTCWKF